MPCFVLLSPGLMLALQTLAARRTPQARCLCSLLAGPLLLLWPCFSRQTSKMSSDSGRWLRSRRAGGAASAARCAAIRIEEPCDMQLRVEEQGDSALAPSLPGDAVEDPGTRGGGRRHERPRAEETGDPNGLTRRRPATRRAPRRGARGGHPGRCRDAGGEIATTNG